MTATTVEFIDADRAEFGAGPVRAVLQAAPPTYWSAKRRPPSARSKRDISTADVAVFSSTASAARRRRGRSATLLVLLALWQDNDSVRGARKLWMAARRAGHGIGRDQVARLMGHLEIRGVKQTRRVRTTRPGTKPARPPDLLERDFTAERPNRLRVADSAHAAAWSGVAYACLATDAFSRRIIGWRVASNMRTQTVLGALQDGPLEPKRPP